MSCLFNSFSYFKEITNNDSSEIIRNKICNYLETNPIVFDNVNVSDIILWETNSNLTNYIINMRNTSTWGGAIEIFAFCNIYNVNVNVKNIRDSGDSSLLNNIIQFKRLESPESIKALIQITWNGGHYEPEKILSLKN